MENEIYILIIKDKRNNDEEELIDCSVFDDLEMAKQKLNELKENFMQEIQNEIDNYTIEDDSNDNLASFSAYENGFYDENHFDLIIFQRGIE